MESPVSRERRGFLSFTKRIFRKKLQKGEKILEKGLTNGLGSGIIIELPLRRVALVLEN